MRLGTIPATSQLKQAQRAKANAIFSLYDVGCSTCAATIERELKRMPGITDVNVNHMADVVMVEFDPTQVTSDHIRNQMKTLRRDSLSADTRGESKEASS